MRWQLRFTLIEKSAQNDNYIICIWHSSWYDIIGFLRRSVDKAYTYDKGKSPSNSNYWSKIACEFDPYATRNMTSQITDELITCGPYY